MIGEDCTLSTIPLPNVGIQTAAVVLDYLNMHGNSGVSAEDKQKYDAEIIAAKPMNELFHILLAANYLEIKDLLELVTQTIAHNMKDMSVADVRQTFGVKSDLTPEEEWRDSQGEPMGI